MTKAKNDFTLIKASRVIDGLGGPAIERGAVLVEGDQISKVAPEEEIVVPEGANVEEIVYENKTVLPGLIDCHVHMIGIGDGRVGDELTKLPDEVLTLQAAKNARIHLYSGVTTVRDCGAKNNTTFMLRQAVEMGITPSPRLLLTGRPISIIGGHLSYFGIEATGEVECRAAVRQLIKEGADFIKVTATGGSTRTSFPFRPSFTLEELIAISDEAHKFGKHTAAHCVSTQAIINALDAGIDTVIHGAYREPDGSYLYRPEVTERLAEQGVFVNLTMHQAREHQWELEKKKQDDGLSMEEQRDLDNVSAGVESSMEHGARLKSGGVKLVSGSDAAWARYKMGGFQDEIQAHVEIGMTPMEAIVSATSDSARSCWAEDSIGSLEAGKLADLLVVDGDPSAEINDLKNVVDVFQNGAQVDRSDYV
ncbi:MAG: amidohydrolase family protein [Chloroflexota bacterium]|nr:amidohydrolase family protein [Chloroflexota bacterium]